MNVPSHARHTWAIPRTAGWLAAGLLIAVFAIPTQALAQACAGGIDIELDGTDVNGDDVPDYLLSDLPETVNWELTARAGGFFPIDVNEVRFALTCFNNGDAVPCIGGNDRQAGDAGSTPLQYGSLAGGTCGASFGGESAGILTFNLPDALLGSAGCTIEFSTSLEDLGIDGSPNFVTPAIAFDGTCLGGVLSGGARGSASVEIIDPAIEVTKTGPNVAKVGDAFDYTISFTVLRGAELLGECRGNDPLLGGDLGVFLPDTPRTFSHTPQAGDPDPLDNTVTISCAVVGSASTVVDDDSWTVDLIDPQIDATKTGPDSAKVGDTITYTIGFTSANDGGFLGTCTGSDTVLGDLGVFTDSTTRDFSYVVQPGDADPLLNVATITCDIEGFDNQASASAEHSVDLIGPAIDVTKTGPDSAKIGDTVTYTIGFNATSAPEVLGTCTGSDTVLGGLGVFTDGTTRDFSYVVQPGDPDPLLNVATITCDIEGFDNQASDSAEHSVDLINPSVNLTKECRPDPVRTGEDITWAITVENTGDIDLDCLVNDANAGFVDEAVAVAAGDSAVLSASRVVEEGDAPVISNTATVDCPIPGFDNGLDDEATADCEVETEEESICLVVIDEEGVDNDFRSIERAADVIDNSYGITPGELINDEENDFNSGVPTEVGNPPFPWNILVDMGKVLPGIPPAGGDLVLLPTGQVDDEGWFSLPPGPEIRYKDNSRPPNCIYGAGREGYDDWIDAFIEGTLPQDCLDEVLDVMPLRNQDLARLVGRECIAVVYDSDISINYKPLFGNLQGARYGLFHFFIQALEVPGSIPESKSDTSLYDLWLRILGVFDGAAEPLDFVVVRDHEPPAIEISRARCRNDKLFVRGESDFAPGALMTVSVDGPDDGSDPFVNPNLLEAPMNYIGRDRYSLSLDAVDCSKYRGQRLSIQTDEGGAYNHLIR